VACTIYPASYPASSQWHYNGSGNTLENYYYGSSGCLWFAGDPPAYGDFVNIGSCSPLNQNNKIIEVAG
jgi:hypothetical protein